MNDFDGLIHELHHHLSVEQVLSNTDILRNTNVDGLEPRLIVVPNTIEQVSQVVALMNKHNLTLLAYGGGVRMSMAAMPERFDVLLDMRNLSRMLEHDTNTYTCRVEAGMMLSTLQEQLAKKGQRLALDLPEAEQTTLGGLLATNACGPLMLRYGTPREHVRSITVVRPDGTLTSDMDSIGALGMLGVIVEAQLMLASIPETSRTLLLTYADVHDAMNSVFALLGSSLEPSAIELIDAGGASDLSNFFGISMPTNGYTLALVIEGTRANVEQHMSDIQAVARIHNAFLTDDLEDGQQQLFWDAVRNHTQGTVTCTVTLSPRNIVSFLGTLESTCSRYNLDYALIAHAGNGVLYVELRPGDATPRLIEAIAALRVHAHSVSGTLLVERCPIDLRRRLPVQTTKDEGPALVLARQLVQQIDPKGTFARGKAFRS